MYQDPFTALIDLSISSHISLSTCKMERCKTQMDCSAAQHIIEWGIIGDTGVMWNFWTMTALKSGITSVLLILWLQEGREKALLKESSGDMPNGYRLNSSFCHFFSKAI